MITYSFYILELAVSLFVIYKQIEYYLQAKRLINMYQLMFPEKDLDESFINRRESRGTEMLLIKEAVSAYPAGFKEMIKAINNYLAKNHGSIDFGIIKSMVDRTTHGKENEIGATVSMPLYVGLMGTFAGIIIGLIRIAFFGGVSDENINAFVGGILIAMSASLLGLFLTVLNNTTNYKKAKLIVDERKNSFFNFLQIELLPHLGNSLHDALDRLKININDFNDKFSNNINLFDTNFTSNIWYLKESVEGMAANIAPVIENTETQKEFLKELRAIGYNRMAEANVKVFTLMKEAGPNFVKFIDKQKELNESITKTTAFVTTIESILNRLTTFEQSINKLGERIDNADYMSANVIRIIERKLSELDRQFDLLKQHSQHTTADINDYFISERARISALVGHIRNEIERALDFNIENNPLQKLMLLEKLEELQTISTLTQEQNKALNRIVLQTDDLSDAKEALKTITGHLHSIDQTLIEINEDNGTSDSDTSMDNTEIRQQGTSQPANSPNQETPKRDDSTPYQKTLENKPKVQVVTPAPRRPEPIEIPKDSKSNQDFLVRASKEEIDQIMSKVNAESNNNSNEQKDKQPNWIKVESSDNNPIPEKDKKSPFNKFIGSLWKR